MRTGGSGNQYARWQDVKMSICQNVKIEGCLKDYLPIR
jgi:hypothetical protein